MEHYSAVRKDEVLPFVTAMNIVNVMVNEISQSEVARNHVISLTCGSLFLVYFALISFSFAAWYLLLE